jgi:hypothetical protein
MEEQHYRESPRPVHKTCPRCGTPVMPDRMVYSSAGELVCAGCDVGDDSTAKLRRGALTTAWAACGLGAIGAIAFIFLLGTLAVLGEAFQSRAGARLSAGVVAFLCVLVFIGASSIAGSLRTLRGPAVITALEGKTARLTLITFSGIVIGPFALGLWVAVLSLH